MDPATRFEVTPCASANRGAQRTRETTQPLSGGGRAEVGPKAAGYAALLWVDSQALSVFFSVCRFLCCSLRLPAPALKRRLFLLLFEPKEARDARSLLAPRFVLSNPPHSPGARAGQALLPSTLAPSLRPTAGSGECVAKNAYCIAARTSARRPKGRWQWLQPSPRAGPAICPPMADPPRSQALETFPLHVHEAGCRLQQQTPIRCSTRITFPILEGRETSAPNLQSGPPGPSAVRGRTPFPKSWLEFESLHRRQNRSEADALARIIHS